MSKFPKVELYLFQHIFQHENPHPQSAAPGDRITHAGRDAAASGAARHWRPAHR